MLKTISGVKFETHLYDSFAIVLNDLDYEMCLEFSKRWKKFDIGEKGIIAEATEQKIQYMAAVMEAMAPTSGLQLYPPSQYRVPSRDSVNS